MSEKPLSKERRKKKKITGEQKEEKNANTDLKQILAIADWYDALRNSRAYKNQKTN